jgi:hypothetical protein
MFPVTDEVEFAANNMFSATNNMFSATDEVLFAANYTSIEAAASCLPR